MWSRNIQLACKSAAAQRYLLKSQGTLLNVSSAISSKPDVQLTNQAYLNIHNKALQFQTYGALTPIKMFDFVDRCLQSKCRFSGKIKQ